MSDIRIIGFLFIQILLSGIFLYLVQRLIAKNLEPKSLNGHYITLGDFNRLTNQIQLHLEEKIEVIKDKISYIEKRLEEVEKTIKEIEKKLK